MIVVILSEFVGNMSIGEHGGSVELNERQMENSNRSRKRHGGKHYIT